MNEIHSYCLSRRARVYSLLTMMVVYPAFAIDILVSNTNDSGPGSLRQAVIDNNTLGGGATIVFSNVVTGTITLTSGDLLIRKHGTIRGPGAAVLAINGNATNRVFHIQITNDTSVLISGLTLTNGGATNIYPFGNIGGAIWNDHSTVRLEKCALNGNFAAMGGGIYNDGTSNSASLLLEGCTFSGNSAGDGGAIYNYAYQGTAGLLIRACVFKDNRAFNGGAVRNDGYEGFGSVTVSTSTFTSNSATGSGVFVGGGGIYNHGLAGIAGLYVNASTFNGNSAQAGGDIFNNAPTGSATVEIGNTILRAGASGGTIFNNFGAVTSRGYNLSSDNGGGVLTNSTDRLNLDPLLGPLADNGGPTMTHALLPGSPAIDQGKRNTIPSLALTTDQRGADRPFDFASVTNAPGGDGSDIGAFEFGRPLLSLVLNGSSAVLSWQAVYGDFNLETTTNLSVANWTSVSNAPLVVGDKLTITNPVANGIEFYRLHSP